MGLGFENVPTPEPESATNPYLLAGVAAVALFVLWPDQAARARKRKTAGALGSDMGTAAIVTLVLIGGLALLKPDIFSNLEGSNAT